MQKKILSALISIALFAGCASKCILIRSEYFDITGRVFSAKASPEDVQILAEPTPKSYKQIGVVKVLARYGTKKETINKELKKRAAQAGADAIIEVQYGEDRQNDSLMCGLFGSTKRNISAVGKAVVFTKDSIKEN